MLNDRLYILFIFFRRYYTSKNANPQVLFQETSTDLQLKNLNSDITFDFVNGTNPEDMNTMSTTKKTVEINIKRIYRINVKCSKNTSNESINNACKRNSLKIKKLLKQKIQNQNALKLTKKLKDSNLSLYCTKSMCNVCHVFFNCRREIKANTNIYQVVCEDCHNVDSSKFKNKKTDAMCINQDNYIFNHKNTFDQILNVPQGLKNDKPASSMNENPMTIVYDLTNIDDPNKNNLVTLNSPAFIGISQKYRHIVPYFEITKNEVLPVIITEIAIMKNFEELSKTGDEKNDQTISKEVNIHLQDEIKEADSIFLSMTCNRDQVIAECFSKNLFLFQNNCCKMCNVCTNHKKYIKKNFLDFFKNRICKLDLYNKLASNLNINSESETMFIDDMCRIIDLNFIKGDIKFIVLYDILTTIKFKPSDIYIPQLMSVFNSIVDIFSKNKNNSTKLFPQFAVLKKYLEITTIQIIQNLDNKEKFLLMCVMTFFLQLMEIDWYNILYKNLKYQSIFKDDLYSLFSKIKIKYYKNSLIHTFLFVKVELGKFLTYLLGHFIDKKTQKSLVIMMSIEEILFSKICCIKKSEVYGCAIHDIVYFYNISKKFFAISLVESHKNKTPCIQSKNDFCLKPEHIIKNTIEKNLYFSIDNLQHFETFFKFQMFFFSNNNFLKYIEINKIYYGLLSINNGVSSIVDLTAVDGFLDTIKHLDLQVFIVNYHKASKANDFSNFFDKHVLYQKITLINKILEILNNLESKLSCFFDNENLLKNLSHVQKTKFNTIFANFCLDIYLITFEIFPFKFN